ncbi:MAG: class I SAM-dependent methyltransferase [Magnetococcales bacterium]|nr:class I SAM-dependent methyltransferase [Magnetococcales bacterium]NGZ06252.1 class I SAM-dependent methyltransferase [Magnetococcales bacterium]
MTNANITALLAAFPKKRPQLPAAYLPVYDAELAAGRTGHNWIHRMVLWAEGWMHRTLERSGHTGPVLEIGAGTLNHLRHVCQTEAYDIVEPSATLLARADPKDQHRIRHVYQDLSAVDPSLRYDRILSVAVLEHLEELPFVIARSALLLTEHGVFQAGLPNEGALLWHMGSTLTTGIAFRLRTGLSYTPLIRYEHINTVVEIERIIGYFFASVHRQRFPVPWLHASFYTCIEAQHPRLDLCRQMVLSR